jgi:hypothetical protein
MKNRGVADLQIGYARDHRPSTGRGKGRPVVLTMHSAAVGSAENILALRPYDEDGGRKILAKTGRFVEP